MDYFISTTIAVPILQYDA